MLVKPWVVPARSLRELSCTQTQAPKPVHKINPPRSTPDPVLPPCPCPLCPAFPAPLFRRVFFEEAVGDARQKLEEAERRKRKARDNFGSFLRHARGLYADTPWDEFEDAFSNEPEFKEVGGDRGWGVMGGGEGEGVGAYWGGARMLTCPAGI